MTPKSKSTRTTKPSTPYATRENLENIALRDIARWFTTIIIPVLLVALLGWVAWLNQTVNFQTTNQSVMFEKISNAQNQRQDDNENLRASMNDLRKSISELKGSIDSLQTTTAAQQAALAVLMRDQPQKQQR